MVNLLLLDNIYWFLPVSYYKISVFIWISISSPPALILPSLNFAWFYYLLVFTFLPYNIIPLALNVLWGTEQRGEIAYVYDLPLSPLYPNPVLKLNYLEHLNSALNSHSYIYFDFSFIGKCVRWWPPVFFHTLYQCMFCVGHIASILSLGVYHIQLVQFLLLQFAFNILLC